MSFAFDDYDDDAVLSITTGDPCADSDDAALSTSKCQRLHRAIVCSQPRHLLIEMSHIRAVVYR